MRWDRPLECRSVVRQRDEAAKDPCRMLAKRARDRGSSQHPPRGKASHHILGRHSQHEVVDKDWRAWLVDISMVDTARGTVVHVRTLSQPRCRIRVILELGERVKHVEEFGSLRRPRGPSTPRWAVSFPKFRTKVLVREAERMKPRDALIINYA